MFPKILRQSYFKWSDLLMFCKHFKSVFLFSLYQIFQTISCKHAVRFFALSFGGIWCYVRPTERLTLENLQRCVGGYGRAPRCHLSAYTAGKEVSWSIQDIPRPSLSRQSSQLYNKTIGREQVFTKATESRQRSKEWNGPMTTLWCFLRIFARKREAQSVSTLWQRHTAWRGKEQLEQRISTRGTQPAGKRVRALGFHKAL